MIGIFDSGVGGLSVFCELKKIRPEAEILYLSDSANFPYGDKSQEELLRIVTKATDFLISQGAGTVVVACNSATVSTIKYLRDNYPLVTFVGVEPAVKVAYDLNYSGKIGILATKKTVATHKSEKLAPGSTLYKHYDAKIIDLVENDYQEINRDDLQAAIEPFLHEDVKIIVLGCTHLYFIKEMFVQSFPEVTFIEPSEAVARRVLEVSENISFGESTFFVTGEIEKFDDFLVNVVGYKNAVIREI
ncbi:MAG: glutamate racemase [bacterium]